MKDKTKEQLNNEKNARQVVKEIFKKHGLSTSRRLGMQDSIVKALIAGIEMGRIYDDKRKKNETV